MAVLRKRRPQAVSLPVATLEDERLSWRARGVLAGLVAKPDGWDVRSEAIARAGTEGRDAVLAALRELGRCGYYRVARRQLVGAEAAAAGVRPGVWVTVTEISDVPVPAWQQEWAAGEEAGGKPPPPTRRPPPAGAGPTGVGLPDSGTGDGLPDAGGPDAGAPGPGHSDATKSNYLTDPVVPSAPAGSTTHHHHEPVVVDPEPSQPEPAAGGQPGPASSGQPGPAAGARPGSGAEQLLASLPPPWATGRRERAELTARAGAALAAGWDPLDLAGYLTARPPPDMRRPGAVLAHRLRPDILPDPPATIPPADPDYPWCGHCDQVTRLLAAPDAAAKDGERAVHCPHCHPLHAHPQPPPASPGRPPAAAPGRQRRPSPAAEPASPTAAAWAGLRARLTAAVAEHQRLPALPPQPQEQHTMTSPATPDPPTTTWTGGPKPRSAAATVGAGGAQ